MSAVYDKPCRKTMGTPEDAWYNAWHLKPEMFNDFSNQLTMVAMCTDVYIV